MSAEKLSYQAVTLTLAIAYSGRAAPGCLMCSTVNIREILYLTVFGSFFFLMLYQASKMSIKC